VAGIVIEISDARRPAGLGRFVIGSIRTEMLAGANGFVRAVVPGVVPLMYHSFPYPVGIGQDLTP